MIFFFKNIFQEYHQSVKQLDPYQARRFLGPDLGPNCLQRLSADEKKKSLLEGKELIMPKLLKLYL